MIVPYVVFSQKEPEEQEKVNELEEVVITATRTLRQLSSLPLPAQIISKKQLKSTNSIRLVDVLNEQTGLVTVPDYGGGEGIQLQGMDSQYTLILIDGVPLVGRLAGTLDLNRISVGNIKQIEVIKGASSSLYGNEALGGVINIITDTPKIGFKGNAYLQVNSVLSSDLGTTLNYKNNDLGVVFFVNRYQNQGYDLDKTNDIKTVDPYVNNTFSLKVNYIISENTKFLASARYYHQNQDIVIKTISKKKAEGEGVMNEWNTQLKLDHKFSNKWNGFLELYSTKYTTSEYYNTADNSISNENSFDQLLIKPEARVIYNHNKNHQAILGFGLTHEALDKSYFIDVPNFNAFYSYFQADMNFFEKMNVIAGVRFDKHSEYGSQLSPKIAVRYKVLPKLNIKTSVGYGFKTPDFRQLYNNFTNSAIGYTVLGYNAVKTRLPELQNEGQILSVDAPMTDFDGILKPESSVAYNFGIDYKFSSKFKIDLNFFRNNIKNLIDTYSIATKFNNQKVFAYRNINKIYTQGIETNLRYKITNFFTISEGYQFLLARDREAEDSFRREENFTRLKKSNNTIKLKLDDYFGLLNRSKHMANIKVFYKIPEQNLDVNIRGTYRSKFGLQDTNANRYLDEYDDFIDGYMLWNVAVNKQFYKNYKLSLGVNNVFDFTNKEITNIQGRIFYAKLFVKF